MPVTVDPSEVHSISVDPSQVSAAAPSNKTWFEHLTDAIAGAGEELNPAAILKNTNDAVQSAFWHPLDTAKNMAQANEQALENARAAWKRGDHVAAAAHFFNYLVPGGSAIEAGPTASIERGDVGRGLGQSVGLGLQLALPDSPYVRAAIAKLPAAARVTPALRNPNPVVADAVDYGMKNDIPVAAGTATGNKFVQGAQALAEHSPAGSLIDAAARREQADAFRRVGGELAERAAPGASVAPAQSGGDIVQGIRANISARNAEASAAYGNLREIEADPANLRNVQTGTRQVPAKDAKGQTIPDKFIDEPVMEDVALPVDMRPVKDALRPVHEQLMRQMPITQQRASAGMKALENIMNGPDAVSASTADMDLGTIKASARGADMPELRSLSQGTAAKAVQVLHDAVTDAVGQARRSAGQSVDAAIAEAPGTAAVPVPGGAQTEGANAGGAQQGPANTESPRAGAQGPRSAETTVTIPGESTRYKARYEVRELGDVQASHNGQTFAPDPRYDWRNDRNYQTAANQRKIVDWSTQAQFDPGYHITDNPDATNGPPLIDSAGNVLGGNGRTMILQRVYAGNPEGAAAYRQMLAERAPQFGVDPRAIAGMKQPVLVRVLDDSHIDGPEAAQNAITNFNKTGTAALTPAERAIADARRVSPETLSDLSDRMQELGPDATLAKAIEGRAGVDLLRRLESDGVLSPQEAAAYRTEDALTPAGRQRVSQLMLGRFFRDADQLDSLPASIRNKVERVAGPLAKLEGEAAYSLTDHVKQGIDLLESARRSGLTAQDYLNQAGLFTKQQYSPEAIAIAHELATAKPTDLAATINRYAEHARYAANYEGPGLFGELPEPVTPREAFNQSFGTSIPETGPAAPAETPQAPALSEAFRQAFAPETPAIPAARTPVAGVPAGQEALAALEAGRAATRRKYASAGVLDQLPGKGVEGRQVFDQAIWANDAGVERLRQIRRETPEEMPRLGRAYLEDLFDRAGAEGGWDKSRTLLSRWQSLGPETRKILFPNPMLRQDLDRFFLLAKKAAEVPNPSGTATVASIGGWGYTFRDPARGIPMVIGGAALAKLLHSPAGVRALTEGLSVPVRETARAAIAANRILKVAGDAATAQPSNVIPFPQSTPSAQPPAAASQ